MTTPKKGPFPAWVTAVQAKYMNPLLRPVAPHLPGFARLRHRGRKSGREYSTVVTPVGTTKQLTILLGHGADTDWVRNVLAADEVDVQLRSGRRHYVNPRVIPKGGADADLPRLTRLLSRWLPVFVADRA
jgi:deazaflavin-dependent oxidoreductase (nitroreductase family)